MVTKVRDIPAELIPHISTIKEVAKKYGINQIGLDVFVEADLPYETAILKLEYDLRPPSPNFGMDEGVILENFGLWLRHDYNLRAWLPVKPPNTANHQSRSSKG